MTNSLRLALTQAGPSTPSLAILSEVEDLISNPSCKASAHHLFLGSGKMNIKNFSLDWIQPSPAQTPSQATDPWVEAVNYYKPPILEILQKDGSTKVQELFEKTQQVLQVPQLQLDQFVGVIDRMILNRQLTVKERGDSPGQAIVALPVPM